ncbi:hypothetical protein C8R41DRAFT_341784 [Lentinula lateritia]|uniref:Secreted protein n=1 Tax=Lentinula lateritia TaxID=40482 RepID=A0ABQ8VFC2_9AGAR|nr:hypothetical protein C8R41DRAFT_341784 [Lentinula lateritia]
MCGRFWWKLPWALLPPQLQLTCHFCLCPRHCLWPCLFSGLLWRLLHCPSSCSYSNHALSLHSTCVFSAWACSLSMPHVLHLALSHHLHLGCSPPLIHLLVKIMYTKEPCQRRQGV